MNLAFRPELASNYRAAPQKARVLSEDWVQRCLPCPNCGNTALTRQANNSRVSDFACHPCREHFELKASTKLLGSKIPDGAYHAMAERLQSNSSPNLLYLHYDPAANKVRSLSLIPKHFITIDSIERRRPLGQLARRAGWVGCNIIVAAIPTVGVITIIHDGVPQDQATVRRRWNEMLFLRETTSANARRWIIETIRCIEHLGDQFTLSDVYRFEPRLAALFPNNHHIRPKLRQQLQYLRDKGYLVFLGAGSYQRLR